MKTNQNLSKEQAGLIWAFIGIAGLAIYFHILPGEFISDDYRFIAQNPVITGLQYENLLPSFNARFLVGLTFMWNYHLHGLNPIGYHLFSLLVHMLNAGLVFVFCRQTLVLINERQPANPLPERKMAWLAAAIFLCHPVQTQAVSFIAQRGTLLVTLFYLLAHIFYMKGRREAKPVYLVLMFLPVLMGFFSKEIIITVGVSLCLCEWLVVRPVIENKKGAYPWLIAVMLATLLFPVLFFQTKSTSTIKFQHLMGIDMFEWKVLLTQFNVLVTYLRLFVAPVVLRADYYYPVTQSILEPRFLLSIVILGGLLWVMITSIRKRPLISYCLAWFFLTKSVEFIGVSFGLRNLIYENWLYLSMVGLCLLAAYMLTVLVRRPGLFNICAVVLVVVLGINAHNRNYVWVNEIEHYQDLVAKEPQFPAAYLGLADAYSRKGNDKMAMCTLQQAIRLKPDFTRALNNLGILYAQQGNVGYAQAHFEMALRADPGFFRAYRNLGYLAYVQQDYQQAVQAYEKYLTYMPTAAEGHFYLGLSYAQLNRQDAARRHLIAAKEQSLRDGNQTQLAAAEEALEEL